MFSVEQKRGISDAVQKILRATNHPELPQTGEITFSLKVLGAESWSYADIKNNGAVGDPGVNPHNELMASMPEEEARELIDAAVPSAQDPSFHGATPYMPDPRNTPDDFRAEMLKQQSAALAQRVQKVEAIVVDYNKRLQGLELDVQAHEKRLTQVEQALRPVGTADSDVNPLVTPMEQLRRVVKMVHEMEDKDKIHRKLYSELRFGLDKLQDFLTPIIEDQLIQHHDSKISELGNQTITVQEDNKSLHTRINSLETAIRQLGSPLVDGGG
jgi:hypothetical protein